MKNNLERLETPMNGNSGQSTVSRYDAEKIGGSLSQIFTAIDHLRPERQQLLLTSLRDMVLSGNFTGVTKSYIYNAVDGARQEIMETWASLFDPSAPSQGDDTVMQDTALEAIDSRLREIVPAVSNLSNRTALPMAYAKKHEANPDSFPDLDSLQINFYARNGLNERTTTALAHDFVSRYRLKFGDAVHLAWIVINAEPSLEVINVLNARHHFVK